MVWHHRCEHYIGKGKSKSSKNVCLTALGAYHLPEYPAEENERIKCTKDKDESNYHQCPVGIGERHQHLVELAERPHEVSQQRVTVYVITYRPIAQHAIGDGVESRDVPASYEITEPQFCVRQRTPILHNIKRIESYESYQCHQCGESFFLLYLEYAEKPL